MALRNACSRRHRTHPDERSLLATTPLVADAWLHADGGVARVTLDPMLVRARAEQQGLTDSSHKAAAGSRRVQALIASGMTDSISEVHVVDGDGDLLAVIPGGVRRSSDRRARQPHGKAPSMVGTVSA